MLNSVEEISKNGSSDDSTTGVRFEIWKLTLDEIKSNWFFGVGAGDIKPVLFKRYKSSNLDNALSKNLNVHNQYLETFLGQGIIGISLLLSLFVIGLKEAYLRKEWLFSVFIILSAMSFAPESMLNNQSGVIFFAFFYYSFFIFTNERSLV
jgi:O-antigen ligase